MNTVATMGTRIIGSLALIALLFAGTATAQQIVPPDDVSDLADLPLVFNVDTEDIDWEGYTMFPFEGGGLDRIANPDKSGQNVTDYVIKYGKYAGQPWAGFFYHTDGPFHITDDAVFRLNVWSPRAGINAMLKLEMREFPDVNTGDLFTPITVANEWDVLEWDLSNIDRDTPWDRVVIIMDLQGSPGDGSDNFIWYLDDFEFSGVTTNIEEGQELARSITLDQNYPNPFNPTTNISFNLPQASHATLQVFDMLGRNVATVVDQTMAAGSHTVNFTATDLPSGIYIYRLQAGNEVRTRVLTLMK
jgi:hypothetical protein